MVFLREFIKRKIKKEELRGSLLLVMSPPFISILTNAYYGGNIEVLKTSRQEFTATEERIIEMSNEGLMRT